MSKRVRYIHFLYVKKLQNGSHTSDPMTRICNDMVNTDVTFFDQMDCSQQAKQFSIKLLYFHSLGVPFALDVKVHDIGFLHDLSCHDISVNGNE